MTNSATTQTHILSLGLAHPNSCPICDLLEFEKGLVLQPSCEKGLPRPIFTRDSKMYCGLST